MRLVHWHAQHPGQVRALQVVPQVELNDLAVARVQPADGVEHEAPELPALREADHAIDVIGHLAGLVQVREAGPGAQAAVALVARHRVQPRPEPGRITQAADFRGGNDKGVLNRVRGIGRLAQQTPAVAEQARRVTVVSSGKTRGIAGNDCGDNVAV